MLPGDELEAFQLAVMHGDEKVLLVAAAFRNLLRGRVRRRELQRMVTPEALPSLLRYRRHVDRLLRGRGMANMVDYQGPDVAMVKMTEDPGYTLRAVGPVPLMVIPVVLHRRPDLPHEVETGGWRVHHVGDPTRRTPGYAPPSD